MHGSKRLLAIFVLSLISLAGLPSAMADGRGGFGPKGRSPGFNNRFNKGFGFRYGFPPRGGYFPDKFYRYRGPRFCWCGFDFYRYPGVYHHHNRFDRFPGFPHRGPF